MDSERYVIKLPQEISSDISYYDLLKIAGNEFRRSRERQAIHVDDISKILRPISVANFPKKIGRENVKKAVLEIEPGPFLPQTVKVYLSGGIQTADNAYALGNFEYDSNKHQLKTIRTGSPLIKTNAQDSLDIILVSYSPESKMTEESQRIAEERIFEIKSGIATGAVLQSLSQGINSTEKLGFSLEYHFDKQALENITNRLSLEDRYVPRAILSVGYRK